MSAHASDGGLPLTGERTAPGIVHENYWFARHVAAYTLAARRARGVVVLDAGCGEGYGTRILAGAAARVLGVDRVPDVVAHARRAYPEADLLVADVCDLPLADESVDLVVSLQVIEHVAAPDRLVAEAARVLRPGGELLCATPNRVTFSPGAAAPTNPFHIREFTAGELFEELSRALSVTGVLGLHHGPRLRALERLARRGLPNLLLATPPDAWPRWLRAAVARVRPADFRWRGTHGSLDLLALGRRPHRAPSAAPPRRSAR